MSELNPRPKYHDILMKLMRKLGYPREVGLCHGLALMGLQACVIGEVEEFNKRLAYIAAHSDLLTAIKSKKPTQEVIDVMAFLDGVSLNQSPDHHMRMFGKHFSQYEFNAPLAFTASRKLEEKLGLHKLMLWRGIYTDDELDRYSCLLNKIAVKSKQPMSLLLSGSGHAIALYYDPQISSWYGIDANQLPISVIKTDLSEWIKNAMMEKSNYTAFNTRVLTLGNSPKENMQLHRIITESSQELNKLHQISEQNARYETSSGMTLAYLAAQEGDLNMISKLYAVNADMNKSTDDGATLLYIAAQCGHANLVTYLHSVGADVNKGMDNGITPAISAARWGHFEVLQALARAGANLTQETAAGTPLKMAKSKHRKDCIEFLKKHSVLFAPSDQPKKTKRKVKVIYKLARE